MVACSDISDVYWKVTYQMYIGRCQARWKKCCLIPYQSCSYFLFNFSSDAVLITTQTPFPLSAMFTIVHIKSHLLFSSPPSSPRTLLCSVLLWACASALQTILKYLPGSTLPFLFQLVLFLFDLPLMFTNNSLELFLLFFLYFCICQCVIAVRFLFTLLTGLNIVVTRLHPPM